MEQARAARQELLGQLESLEPPLDREEISGLLGRESLPTLGLQLYLRGARAELAQAHLVREGPRHCTKFTL